MVSSDNLLEFKILTPWGILFSEDLQSITVPGSEGDFVILPGIQPFISTLRPGFVVVDLNKNETQEFVVLEGLVSVRDRNVNLFSQNVKSKEDISKEYVVEFQDSVKSLMEKTVHDPDLWDNLNQNMKDIHEIVKVLG